MAPAVTFSDFYEGMAYQGGAKVLHDLRWVVANIIPAEIERRVAGGEKAPAGWQEGETGLGVNEALAELPLARHPLIREYAPFYLEWLVHWTPDPYWRPISPNDRLLSGN